MIKKKSGHKNLKKRGGSGTFLGNTPADPSSKSNATTASESHTAFNPAAWGHRT